MSRYEKELTVLVRNVMKKGTLKKIEELPDDILRLDGAEITSSEKASLKKSVERMLFSFAKIGIKF